MNPGERLVVNMMRAFVRDDSAPPPPPRDVDWEAATERLVASGLVGALGRSFAHVAPAPYRERVEEIVVRLRRWQSIQWLEAERILERLDDLSPIALKGLGLGWTLYRRPEQRPVSDLDILVARGDVDEACRRLEDLGYRAAAGQNDPRFYEEFHFHRILRASSGITVELHWDLSRPDDYFRFDLEGLRRRAGTVDRGNVRARIPDDVDQLLHAASQALLDGYVDLRRILDCGMLIARDAELPRRTAPLAEEAGMGVVLWLALEVTGELLDRTVPADVTGALAPDRLRRRLLSDLELPREALAGKDGRRPGLREYLYVLAAPEGRDCGPLVRRYLVPRKAQLLGFGYSPDHLPGPWARAKLSASRAVALARVLLHQAACLLRPVRPGSARASGSSRHA